MRFTYRVNKRSFCVQMLTTFWLILVSFGLFASDRPSMKQILPRRLRAERPL